MPAVQLTTHVKSSTLYGRSYGRKSKFFRLDGLLLFCIIMGLRSSSSAIIVQCASSNTFFSSLHRILMHSPITTRQVSLKNTDHVLSFFVKFARPKKSNMEFFNISFYR